MILDSKCVAEYFYFKCFNSVEDHRSLIINNFDCFIVAVVIIKFIVNLILLNLDFILNIITNLHELFPLAAKNVNCYC